VIQCNTSIFFSKKNRQKRHNHKYTQVCLVRIVMRFIVLFFVLLFWKKKKREKTKMREEIS